MAAIEARDLTKIYRTYRKEGGLRELIWIFRGTASTIIEHPRQEGQRDHCQ